MQEKWKEKWKGNISEAHGTYIQKLHKIEIYVIWDRRIGYVRLQYIRWSIRTKDRISRGSLLTSFTTSPAG